MADVNSLLQHALGMMSPPTTVDTKKQSVAAAVDQKKSALGKAPDFYQIAAAGSTDAGLASAGELETDVRTMNQSQLWQKYGDAAPQLFRQMADGQQKFSADMTIDRNAGEVFKDSVTGAASSFVGGLGSIAALGTGLVNEDAGAVLSNAVAKMGEVVQGNQSEGVNAARRVQQARSANTSRDNEQQYTQDVAAGDGELVAGLKQFGRDFVDTVGNSTDAAFVAQGSAEAVGSLLSGSPVAAGLRKIGTAVMGGAAKQRAVALAAEIDRTTGVASTARVADRARIVGDKAAWPLATAALEGGGVYTGAVNEIMGMSHDQLMEGSPQYRQMLVDLQIGGASPVEAREQAKVALANQAGKQAAAIQAPIAGVTGMLTRSMEKPFSTPSIGAAARATFVNEPVEEAIQSSTGQLSQNIGIQANADENLNLAKGAGEQGAMGAMFGMTAAGTVQGPAVAALGARNVYRGTKSAVSAAVEAGKPLFRALIERGDRILRQQEQASPVSDQALSAAANELNASAETSAAAMTEALNLAQIDEAVKAEGNQYVSSLVQSLRFDPSELEGLPEHMLDIVRNSKTRADAILETAVQVNLSNNDQDVLNNAAMLWMLMEPVKKLRASDPAAFDSVPKNSPALGLLQDYLTVASSIEDNPTVSRALRAAEAMITQQRAPIQPVTEESLATPQGQQNVQNTIAVASLHPDKGNLAANEQILTHAAQGKLNLSPDQLNTLKASVTLLRARAKMEEKIAASGTRRAKDVVSRQIVARNDPLHDKNKKSALEHTKLILSAVGGQDTELATALLEDLGKFVQHMQNKVTALNTHFENGNPNADGVQYQQLHPWEREFMLSRKGMFVNTGKGSSIDLAQSAAIEAEILADVYNGLVETFPELGQPAIAAVPLNAALIGDAETLAQGFRDARKTPEPKKSTSPVEPAVSAVEANVRRTTDAQLNARLEKTTTNDPLFSVLDAEMTRREDAAVKQLKESNDADRNVDGESSAVVPARDVRVAVRDEAVDSTPPAAKPADKGRSEAVPQAVEKGRDSAPAPVAEVRDPVPDAVDASKPVASLKTPVVVDEETNLDQAAEDASRYDDLVDGLLEANAPTITTPLDDLYGKNNFARSSFTYPEEATTRLSAEESPIAAVRRALSSETRLTSFLSGSTKRNTLTAEAASAYQRLLTDTLAPVVMAVEKQLSDFLAEPYGKAGKTIQEAYLKDGVPVNRWSVGKSLNLTQLSESGDLVYQPQMLEQASLAAMQWLLSSDSFTSVMDESDVAQMTGLSETVLQRTPELIEQLTEGMSEIQAKGSLSIKIRKYMGLRSIKTSNNAYVNGIVDAMAAELLRAMASTGLIDISPIELTPAEHGVEKNKTFNRIVVKKLDDKDALASFQDAIEVASLVEPEVTNYIGDVIPPVAERQMNNNEVANTKNQKDAMGKEQQTIFLLNLPVISFYASLGKDNLLALFGTPLDDEDVFNDTHLKSVKSKNNSVTAAFDHLFGVVADASNVVETAGTALDQTPIRYAYNMTRVGRMQMLGKYGPQASKLVREAILPTQSTLDLSNQNSEAFTAYGLGLAQALGIKVHNQPADVSVTEVMAKLNGGLAPAVEMVREWLSTVDLNRPAESASELTTDQVTQLKDAFAAAKADLSMVGLHALVDYARYLASDDQSAFETSFYLEADGVANGVTNAMALMTTGEFTPEWVNNMAKGGLAFGQATTLAEIRKGDPKDLYEAGSDAGQAHLTKLRKSLDKVGTEQMDHLLNLMSLFNADVIFDPDAKWEKGALNLKRGIAKNPMTITLYGSGQSGIAGKLTSAVVYEIYARMSTLLQARKTNPNISVADAMFPGDLNAADKLARFSKSIRALTTLKPKRKDGALYFAKVYQAGRDFDPKTFSFTASELETMEANMLQLFVKPMRQGITDTVGASLMESVATLRDAAQVQSIFLEAMYKQRIDEKMTEKEANDPTWRRGDFLSQAELNEIIADLRSISPLVQTGDQSFLISSKKTLSLEGRDLEYGRALDDSFRRDPDMFGPGQAGVRAIPMLTIGMGDGMMMQLLAQLGLEGTLKIFDGMNMPLDKIRQYSEQANAAVYESWKGNPHAEMLKTYKLFLDQIDAKDIRSIISDENGNVNTNSPLIRALRLSESFSAEELIEATDEVVVFFRDALYALRGSLEWSAKSIDARHAAIESLPVSVDQMAAAGAPHTNGRPASGRMTVDEVVAALNKAYDEAMNEGTTPKVVAPAIEKVGRVAASGIRVLSPTAIESLSRTEMTDAQKAVYSEIRRSNAVRGYTVVVGTAEQIDAFISETGRSPRPSQEVHGWIQIADKTIYMINPSTETLVHELVHAASYGAILAHYQGKTVGSEVVAAIGRLETLMAEFVETDVSQFDPALRAAYESAKAAILSANLESDQSVAMAKQLNEFMAWGLTNEQLTKDLKSKPAPVLVRLAKGIVAAIKSLIWGNKTAPKVADDFLSNLQFNSGVIFRSQPSIAAVVRSGELHHSTAYGSSNRMDSIRQTFAQKIVDLLNTEKWQRGVKMRQVEVSQAVQEAVMVGLSFNAHGFQMNQQEGTTFRMVLAALATEADIDANSMDRAQELYTHVAKTLTVEDFMADPSSLDPQMRYDAQEKYSVIMGQYLTTKDAKGRSSLLPAFLALATVNDEFRAVLAKMALPKFAKNMDGTLDSILSNAGGTVMDSLSRRLAGDANSKSVRDSVDNLLEHIRKEAQNEQTFLDQYASVSGGIVDRANEIVTNGLQAASDALLARADAAEKNASNALVKGGARLAKLVALVASEKNGAIISEGILTATNAKKMWEPLRTFISDMVGRTESNANVYDMIKAVRSAVQQTRQQFRDGVPQIINSKFKKKVTPEQWTAMFNTLAKTDLAVLRGSMQHADIASLISDQAARDAEINKLEAQIQTSNPRHWPILSAKMKQLAVFMNTGVPGVNLLRNAEAIGRLLGEQKANNYSLPNAATKAAIDKLVSLYALDTLPEATRATVSSLVQSEAEGINFVVDYLVGQRKEEVRKATGTAMLNAYKGYIPSEQEAGLSMQIASDAEFANLRELGYVRVAPYKGSSVELGQGLKSYYFAPLSGRAVFNQGIMQNVRHTAGGVDATSGFTVGMTAGRVTSKQHIARILNRMSQEKSTVETFMPVYNSVGEVVALERSVDPKITAKLNKSTDLAHMIGVWRGRQVEEATSQIYNEQLIDKLKAMYDADMKESSSNKAQYVNLLDSKTAKENPVIADAVSLFTNETLDYIREKFGEDFWVRRDMVRDAVGERSASVGDLWNGVSNMSKDNRDQLRKALVGALGIDAFRKVVTAERLLQNFMADMRTLIVVKSVIVPAANFVSNIYQLISRGVPILYIAKTMPAKLAEIDSYAKTQLRQIEAEAELRASTGNAVAERKLKTEIQSIKDAHRRMSIWPLIEAGEFSSIADVGMQAEDLELTSGKLASYVERLVDKLPESVKTAGRYAMITKDTALYRGLQKSVQYSDFVAKAVLFDDLTKRQKKTKAEALARITEEFVNYDRLPGRFRSYLENSGLLWFYNFKIRSTKVALSTIRNNPVHALMSMTLPAPDFLGTVGSPISDNILAKSLGDTLGSSVGTDMAFRAPTLNPWMNMIH